MDEVSEGIFDKFIVLFQDTDDRSPSFSSISLQSSTKPDIIVTVDEDFVGEKIPYSLIIESHESFKEDYVSRANIGRLLHSGMINERILRHRDRLIGLDQTDKGFVGQIKIEGIWVIEIIFRNINFIFIDVFIERIQTYYFYFEVTIKSHLPVDVLAKSGLAGS